MNFHRADVAVLKKLGVKDLTSIADGYSQYRAGTDVLFGSDRPVPEVLLLHLAVAAGQIQSAPMSVPSAPKPIQIDLGDGVPRTVAELNGKQPPPTGQRAPKQARDRWQKGRLLNYSKTFEETNPETGKRETYVGVVPALFVKKTKTGRFVIEVDGKNVTVAPDKVQDAQNESLREPFRGNIPSSFRNESANTALALA